MPPSEYQVSSTFQPRAMRPWLAKFVQSPPKSL
jgi:hypothetical protein